MFYTQPFINSLRIFGINNFKIMRYLAGFSIIIAVALLSSCIKHEVIPAPTKRVDLPASFTASLNGFGYEIIKDIDGYSCKATQAKELLPTPQLSNMIYYSSLQSQEKLDFIQIGIGKLKFNADHNLDPSLSAFKDFFIDEPIRDYSEGAEDGVEIIFRDGSGKIWKSDETIPGQSFEFTDAVIESDEFGDYLKFTAKFNAVLVLDIDDVDHPDYGSISTLENATFQGYFKR